MVYPLTSEGFMKLGLGDIKVMPNLEKGVMMFAQITMIETKDLLEKNSDLDEDFEFITYLQNSGEVLGISKGMSKYGMDPRVFSEANTEAKPKINDYLMEIYNASVQ